MIKTLTIISTFLSIIHINASKYLEDETCTQITGNSLKSHTELVSHQECSNELGLLRFVIINIQAQEYLTKNSLTRQCDQTYLPLSYKKIIQLSLSAQRNDLIFSKDYTGLGRALEKLNLETRGNPYFYKISKDDISFYGLGSMHIIPLYQLPSFVRQKIYSCKTLILERYESCVPDDNFDAYKNLSFDWYSKLTKEQKYLLRQLKRIKDFKTLDIRAMSSIYMYLHYIQCMDRQIADHFKIHKLIIKGLDTPEENDVAGIDPITFEEGWISLRKILNKTLKYGNFFSIPYIFELMNNYIKGQLQIDEDPSVIDYNLKWWPRLKIMLNEHPEKSIVVVGKAHWLGQNGLLDLCLKEGWTIEQYDLSGQTFPITSNSLGIAH